MTTTLSLPRVATALREPALDTWRLATCPLCHAKRVASTQEPLETDEDWRCARCGQRWDAPRLAAVAAYAEGVARRESARDAGAASHDTGRLARCAQEPSGGSRRGHFPMGRRGRRGRIGEKSADITDTMPKGTTQRTASIARANRAVRSSVARAIPNSARPRITLDSKHDSF